MGKKIFFVVFLGLIAAGIYFLEKDRPQELAKQKSVTSFAEIHQDTSIFYRPEFKQSLSQKNRDEISSIFDRSLSLGKTISSCIDDKTCLEEDTGESVYFNESRLPAYQDLSALLSVILLMVEKDPSLLGKIPDSYLYSLAKLPNEEVVFKGAELLSFKEVNMDRVKGLLGFIFEGPDSTRGKIATLMFKAVKGNLKELAFNEILNFSKGNLVNMKAAEIFVELSTFDLSKEQLEKIGTLLCEIKKSDNSLDLNFYGFGWNKAIKGARRGEDLEGFCSKNN